MNFQMFKLDLEKAEEPEVKLPTPVGSSKKQESSRKTSTSALLIMPKPLTVPWKKSYDQHGQHIKKQRHYFASKDLSSQSYGFSSSHIWMTDRKN